MSTDDPQHPFSDPEPRSDEPIPSTGSDADDADAARTVNRFDIRRVIGGVFVVYGLILVALGIFGSSETKHKAAGVNIDLWTGLGMLVFAALMIFWALSRPTVPEPPETRGEGSGSVRREPGTVG